MIYKENFIQGNHSKDYLFKPRGLVWHHNYLAVEDLHKQMTEKEPYSNILKKPLIPASYHCVGWKDGSRTQFVKNNQRAWHAGNSEFKGIRYCNDFMLSYSFHVDTYAEPLTQTHIKSFIEWFIPIKEEFNLAEDWLTDHKHVAPGRKRDLNPVEYERLKLAMKYLYL